MNIKKQIYKKTEEKKETRKEIGNEMEKENHPSIITMVQKAQDVLDLENEKEINMIVLLDDSDENYEDPEMQEKNKDLFVRTGPCGVFAFSGIPYNTKQDSIRAAEVCELIDGTILELGLQCLSVTQPFLLQLGFDRVYYSSSTMGMRNMHVSGICGKSGKRIYGSALLVKKNIIIKK